MNSRYSNFLFSVESRLHGLNELLYLTLYESMFQIQKGYLFGSKAVNPGEQPDE